MRELIISIVICSAIGCTGDGPDDDPVGIDAATTDVTTADARRADPTGDGSVGEQDALIFTGCGEGPDAIRCNFLFELCVLRGPAGERSPSCEPIPERCDTDLRQCTECDTACVAPDDTCQDDAALNTIICT